jgi:diguanylate cyclase (GGDEF)-like protein
VLLAALDRRSHREYTRLERTLLVLTLVGIVMATIASVFTAKRIAQPLRQLAGTARAGAGRLRARSTSSATTKSARWRNAFDSMRDGIAKREQEIRRLAYWDTLTNLPNRAQFVLLLDDALLEARKREVPVFVLMMDLDRFKHVNDVMGHSFGDALLRQVAERLHCCWPGRPSAQVARLGGDEFAVLLPASDLGHAQRVAAEILQALEQPLSLEDQTVDIGAGLGIAGYPVHGDDAERCCAWPRWRCTRPSSARDGAVVYDPAIDKASEKSLSLLTELRNAIERNEFRLHVQPKIMLDTGKVVGMESLVRWVHPERGNVFPDEFIPFAEQTGFIRVLTRWVLDRSAALCQELAGRACSPEGVGQPVHARPAGPGSAGKIRRDAGAA